MSYSKDRVPSNTLTDDNYVSTENMLPQFGGIYRAQNAPSNGSAIAYQKGDTLLSNIRPYLKKVWLANNNGGCSADVFVLKSVNEKCNSDFLYYLVANDNFISYVMNGAKGVKMPRGDKEQIKKYQLSIPSKKEQCKITELLSKLDQRIATQIRVIEDLQTLKKAISTQLLYEGSLKDIISLAELGTLKNGYAFKSSTYCENGNYNIITIANVTGERYVSADGNRVLDQPCDIQEHQLLKENDILISLTGNVGRVSLNKGTCNLLNQRVGLFELRDNSLREYIFQVLSTPQFESAMKNKGQGAAQMNIGKYDIEEYHIPYSIDHNELLKISEILSLFDSKILMENKLLQLFTQQKTFLLQKMFI